MKAEAIPQTGDEERKFQSSHERELKIAEGQFSISLFESLGLFSRQSLTRGNRIIHREVRKGL